MPDIKKEVELYRRMQKSPKEFVRVMWGLEAQVKGQPFTKGKQYTWQQELILDAVEKAIKDEAPRRISVRSGHGIGKTATFSWLILWFLFCFKESQIPCTAPTSEQMNDALWKEVAKWLMRMPEGIKSKFEVTNTHIRVTERPATWFARAKTARKESPEALAGIHGDYVMLVIDEASGVPEEIFNTAEGALTEPNILVIMISNPTRTVGYFYDSHHKDQKNWQTLHFSSLDSPLVDYGYVNRIIEKHGEDSDEFRIRVLGEFPKLDALDDKGYIPLLMEEDLRLTPSGEFVGEKLMGIDPSGEGDDKTVWVVRDNFKAKVVAQEQISSEKSIAEKTLTLMDYYNIRPENVFIDNFGSGANVAKELALSRQQFRVNSMNVGEKARDEEFYINLRAESFDRMRKWLRQGGELVNHKGWDELLSIRFRRELSGKMKIMGKREMKNEGVKSPNVADALMLTFTRNYIVRERAKAEPYKSNNSYTGYN